MEVVPEEWSVTTISPFLIGLSRESLHRSRNTMLRRNLMRTENIKVGGKLDGGGHDVGDSGGDDGGGGDHGGVVMVVVVVVVVVVVLLVVMMVVVLVVLLLLVVVMVIVR